MIMTKIYFYYLLILLLVKFSWSSYGISKHNIDMGCEDNLMDQQCNNLKLTMEAFCVSYVELSLTCVNNNGYREPVRDIFINLKYRDYGDNEFIPYIRNMNFEQLHSFIVSLDLSDNNYTNLPKIYHLNILRTLNVSHNSILVAKLSNEYQLESLKEIDYSYNKAMNIEIIENEYTFSKLVKLFLSHNDLQEVTKGIFNDFKDLEYLDLSHNYITNLSLFTFDGIQKLTCLKLSHNNIVDINSSLFRFSNLNELFLDNNKIKTILARDFESLHALKILDLSCNSIVTIEGNVFETAILLQSLDVSNNMLKNIDKNMFSVNFNLSDVNLSNNKLTGLPGNLFKGKNVSLFSIADNYLEGTIKRDLFEGLKLKNILDLSSQSFTFVEDYAFFGLVKITELLLNNNTIHSVSHKAFKTLHNLLLLDLSYNQISNLDFDKEDLLSLQSLLLQGNHIKEILNTQLKTLHRLQFIDLSQNNISHIEPQSFRELGLISSFQIFKNPLIGVIESSTFKGLNSVPILDLSCTFLSTIQNGSLDGMSDLNELNISRSNVREVHYNAFVNTGNIKIIDMSYNILKSFVINTTELIGVKQLLLSHNLIMSLSSEFVKGMINLNKICLSYNSISFLYNDTFKDQRDLRYLDLSNNINLKIEFSLIKDLKNLNTLVLSNLTSNLMFEEYKETALTRLELQNSNIFDIHKLNLNVLTKLEFIQIGYNNLTQLVVGGFSNLTNLKDLDLSYNKITIIQPGVFKDNVMLNTLNLSHNALSEIGYGIFRGLTRLNVLDVSFNFINSLESERFFEVESLSELIIDYNRIKNVSVEDFRGTRLSILSIGDNPLPCKILSSLIKHKHPNLIITALRCVDVKENNLYGIKCDGQNYENIDNTKISYLPFKGNNSDDLLIDIRNILFHLSSKQLTNENVENDETLDLSKLEKLQEENVKQISQLGNFVSELQDETKTTNNLLERILKITIALNSINRSLSVPIKDNFTSESLFDYLNKIRQDFSNEMTIEKERILAEVERKLFVLKKQIDTTASTTIAPVNKREKLSSDSDSLIFVKTCVALTLFLAVCLVLLKLYKFRMYILRRRSVSTRPIADAMETSNI